MNSKELMIGDWVLINNVPHKVQAIDNIDAEIQADDDLYYVGEDTYHSEDKIEGILTTSEILEKNGWEYQENLMVMRIAEDVCFLWTKVCGAFSNQLGCYMCDFKYVHTLQHFLRFYGRLYERNDLVELADNFKV